jgi:hypothetical protein
MAMNRRATWLVILLAPAMLSGSQSSTAPVSYSWRYGGAIHGNIDVPGGYAAETHNYQEGIVTYLRYSDSSQIILQHGGMYRVPMFQDSEYVLVATEERPDRTVRSGSIEGSTTRWREDNMKRTGATGESRSFSVMFPPNIAYEKVPAERADLFNRALDSFVWTTGQP